MVGGTGTCNRLEGTTAAPASYTHVPMPVHCRAHACMRMGGTASEAQERHKHPPVSTTNGGASVPPSVMSLGTKVPSRPLTPAGWRRPTAWKSGAPPSAGSIGGWVGGWVGGWGS